MVCVLVQPTGGTSRLQYAVLSCVETPGATPSEPEGGAAVAGAQGHNDTGLQEQFSHLDAPNDSLYVLCGVVIAMLLVGLIIVLLAVTISKLRKRDAEPAAAPAAPAQEVVLHATGPAPPPAPPPQPVTIATIFGAELPPVAVAAPATLLNGNALPVGPPPTTAQPPPLLWQYPAPFALYSTDQDTLVHGTTAERRPSTTSVGHPGFCRGFRRSIRGRWRRLVRRKPTRDPYALPADVREQLKQIYVY